MALPAGITTCVVTAGAPLDFAGQGGTITLTVTPVLGGNATNIVWQATGQPLVNFPMTATADATEQAQVVIPHSDQVGFVDGSGNAFTGWSYKAQISFKGANRQQVAWTKVFQIPTGQTSIDLDLVPDGSITSPTVAPVEPVSSWAGLQGAVTDAEIADVLTDTGTQVGTALAGEFTGRHSSPRGTQRVQFERRPTLTIEQTYPNANVTHKIVHAHNDTLYAVGHDTTLRKSTDAGKSWKALYSPAGTGRLASQGLFLITTAGTILSSYDAFDPNAPKIRRSTDDGATFTDVVPVKPNVLYLGPTSICQDPVTGYIYLAEYVTADAATKPTFDILRSTDDGATWTAFHTFDRTGADAVRHGHGIQWDQFAQRIVFACGDADPGAGLYRVDATGNGIEVMTRNDRIDTASGIYGGAVGVMFFPNHIAWGVDQVSDSGLVRMARDQIGAAAPVIEKVVDMQSTAFYTARAATDGTEWLMTVSNEDGGGGRLDNAHHIYRVADEGATCDEVLTIPTGAAAGFSWTYCVSGPLQSNDSGVIWLGSNSPLETDFDPWLRGGNIAVKLAWGTSPMARMEPVVSLPFYAPSTVSSGKVSLTASEKHVFAVTEVPALPNRRLYIIEASREQLAGTGFFYLEVYDKTGAQVMKMEDGATLMQWQNRSRRSALQKSSEPYICRSGPLSPGTQIYFRLSEVLAQTADGVATLTFAFGQ